MIHMYFLCHRNRNNLKLCNNLRKLGEGTVGNCEVSVRFGTLFLPLSCLIHIFFWKEVRTAMKTMKNIETVGPDEAWRCLGQMAMKFLTRMFNAIFGGERMPKEWYR